MVITLDDARIARNIFTGVCTEPAMCGPDMEASVYSDLARLWDEAAR